MEPRGTYNVALSYVSVSNTVWLPEIFGGVVPKQCIAVILLQYSKAPEPMVVTWFGIVILVKPLQKQNAKLSIIFDYV